MKDPEKLKELILEKVDLTDIMVQYNVSFVYNPYHAEEVQYRCPFHGQDKKPSARLYKATKSCYCWFCRKKWDAISFIMDKENLSYYESLKFIVDRFKLDTSSISNDPSFSFKKPVKIIDEEISLKNIGNRIMDLKKKNMQFDKYRALVTAYFMLLYGKHKNLNIVNDIFKLESKLNQLEGR
jgi:DNA primase